MKKILFLIFFVSGVMNAQTYKVGIVGDYSYTTKIEGSIIITDSIYTLAFKDKAPVVYDVVANKNGVVYITDGVMTDWIQVIEQKGTKKGFEYTHWLILNFDVRKKTNAIVLYYCKIE